MDDDVGGDRLCRKGGGGEAAGLFEEGPSREECKCFPLVVHICHEVY